MTDEKKSDIPTNYRYYEPDTHTVSEQSHPCQISSQNQGKCIPGDITVSSPCHKGYYCSTCLRAHKATCRRCKETR